MQKLNELRRVLIDGGVIGSIRRLAGELEREKAEAILARTKSLQDLLIHIAREGGCNIDLQEDVKRMIDYQRAGAVHSLAELSVDQAKEQVEKLQKAWEGIAIVKFFVNGSVSYFVAELII